MAFTPPSKFPQEYVTADGRRAIILAKGCGLYPYVGQVISKAGAVSTKAWSKAGYFSHGFGTDLQDVVQDFDEVPTVSIRIPVSELARYAQL